MYTVARKCNITIWNCD